MTTLPQQLKKIKKATQEKIGMKLNYTMKH